MQTYGGVKIQLHAFFISGSHPQYSASYCRSGSPRYPKDTSILGPQNKHVDMAKFLCPCLNSTSEPPIANPTVRPHGLMLN